MAEKRKASISIFELVWYPICGAVILWGLTYFVLGLINRFSDLSGLESFCNGFKGTFKLGIQYWGLIIIAIGVVAGLIVMLIYAKTFDRAADREQRRSARLNALRQNEQQVVAEQEPEVVSEAPVVVPEQEIVDEVPEEELKEAAEPEVPQQEEAPAEAAPAAEPAPAAPEA